MNFQDLYIQKLQAEEAIPWELLLEADPSPLLIEKYLKQGDCFTAKSKNLLLAVIVLEAIDENNLEIKNISVSRSFQKKGIGNILLEFASDYAKRHSYKKLHVGTADSSSYQISFYQKAGFKKLSVEKDYFLKNYTEVIMENGVQAIDKICFEKNLT